MRPRGRLSVAAMTDQDNGPHLELSRRRLLAAAGLALAMTRQTAPAMAE